MNIQLLLTGNELMSGHTVDSNSAMIADLLASAGFSISRKVTIGDDFDQLVAEMASQASACDVLIANGGLGPTVDDLTAAALAKLAGVELQQHPGALTHLRDWCEKRRISLNEANLKQALLPAGATLIPNPVGSAVGFSLQHNNCLIICTPGVPSELRAMLEQTIVDTLNQRFPAHQPRTTLRFQTFGLGESTVQQWISRQCPDWPAGIELGFRAGLPQLELKLTLTDPGQQSALAACQRTLFKLMGNYIIGSDNQTLAGAVIELLRQRSQTITVAESCTGGLIAANITEVPGASAVFEAGFVSYSNTMKTALLGVSETLLQQYGAVSEQVVIDMANGALERSGADYAIAVSGIAGPEGGTPDKPVGTVWLAWGSREQLHTRHLNFTGSRKWFQIMAAATGLDLIRRMLLDISEEPIYLRTRAGK